MLGGVKTLLTVSKHCTINMQFGVRHLEGGRVGKCNKDGARRTGIGWVDEVALQTISRPDSQPKLGRKIKWELFCCKTAFCFNDCKNLRY